MSDDTEYLLAVTPQDYRKCREFIKDQTGEDVKLKFPTVYAKRLLTIVGILGTLPRDDMILAGPLLVNTKGNKGFIALNLKIFYEALLKKMGVTLYNFQAEGEQYIDYIRRLGDFEESEQIDSDKVVFKRYL